MDVTNVDMKLIGYVIQLVYVNVVMELLIQISRNVMMVIKMPMMVVQNVKLIWDLHVMVQLALLFHLFVVMDIKVVQNNVMMVIQILEMDVLHYVL